MRALLIFLLIVSPFTDKVWAQFDRGYQTVSLSSLEYDEEDEEDWEDGSGFSIGLNIGAYFANKTTANIYNGSCLAELVDDPSGIRCHTIEERLNLHINTIKHINDFYGSTAFEVPYDSYPYNMRYQPAFMYGMHLQYNFNYESGIFIDFNSMRVRAADRFTLRFIGTTLPENAQEDVRLFDIWATEDRFQGVLGYKQSFFVNDGVYWYMEFGASMLGIKMRENKIRVADTNYDLFIGSDNPNQLLVYQPRTNVGLGFMLGTGMSFTFDDSYYMDLGFGMSRDQVIILNFEDRLWNFSIFGRFSI